MVAFLGFWFSLGLFHRRVYIFKGELTKPANKKHSLVNGYEEVHFNTQGKCDSALDFNI